MAKRILHRQIYQKSKKKQKMFSVFKFLFFIFLFLVFCFGFLFIYYAKDLPRPEKFTERQFIQSTKIYDRTGEVLLYDIHGEEKRTVILLEIVPEHLKQAVLVAEDANFYKHFGLDIRAIFRALITNIKMRSPVQGASTITQQLIRSTFLTREKTIKRKIREIVLTLELERRYSKEQILEWYLNQVPFGSNTYGCESASQTYFKKSVSEISLPESAILASLIRSPSYLSPYGQHKDKLLNRKNYILERMAKAKHITEEEKETAKKEELKFAKVTEPIKAPHFVIYVKNHLIEKYGKEFLETQGLKIFTSLDWALQEKAEEIVQKIAKVNEGYNAHNAGLVAISPKTGEILTMVGSKDYFGDIYPKGCVSRVDCLFEPMVNTTIYGIGRQPGSSFKPFAYAQAIKKGFTPDTILWDAQTNFGVWGAEPYIPENYDKRFRGPIKIKDALAQSINVPSVKVLYLAGIKETIELAQNLGITTLNEPAAYYGLSLVLGGGEVKLLDITSAYGVFAADGLRSRPVSILKIEDAKGDIMEKNQKTPKRILETQTCRLINNMLSDNEARTPMFGRNSQLYFKDYDVAAKTGTTQFFNNAWTIGYTPNLAVGVWVGNNNNAPMAEQPGVVLAGSIWHQFMEETFKKFPKQDFQKPEPIKTPLEKNSLTGQAKKPVLNGEVDWENPHSILYYVDKNNPRGAAPQNPEKDPQFGNWEQSVRNWIKVWDSL